MRKICVITGARSDYGLLYWSMKAFQASKDIDLQIIVTGMHLSHEYGLTYKEIEKDGFVINKKIETVISSNSRIGVSKSIGLGLISFSEAFDELNPDLIFILGDRYEILASAIAATIANIPISHSHGGELTEGAFDEVIRHSITKMSQLHFTSTEEYKKRVIQLGEIPERVHNVGALGIENIKKLTLLDKKSFEKSINFKLNTKNILVTYHPVTLEKDTSKISFQALLTALDKLEDTNIIFTKPNSDTDSGVISELIEKYVLENKSKSISFSSLGQLRYLSALQFMDFAIGNSSSGVLEVPSFNIPTINIGDRQKGRLTDPSVIDCCENEESISKAIKKAFDIEFKLSLAKQTSLYGNGKASEKIVDTILNIELSTLNKKKFHDINFTL